MAKATGIIRRVDDLGRVVLPKELRRTLQIADNDPLEIFVDSDGEIILKKYAPGCAYCGEIEGAVKVLGKVLTCRDCLDKIAAELE